MVIASDDVEDGCTASNIGTVDEFAPAPTCNINIDGITITKPTTIGGSDGTATAVVTGNSGTVNYFWSDTQTSNPATGLSAGDFSLTVSDNGVGATCLDTEPFSVSTALGGNLYQDGVNDYGLLTTAITCATSSDFLIACEFRTNSLGTLDMMFTGSSSNHYIAIKNSTTIALRFGGGQQSFVIPILSTDTWYHLLINRVNNMISVYIDGVASVTVKSFTNSFELDSLSKYVVSNYEFGGGIDNWYINSTTSATSGEITSIVANPQNTNTIIGGDVMLEMNGTGTDTTAPDTSGNSNDMTLYGYAAGAPKWQNPRT